MTVVVRTVIGGSLVVNITLEEQEIKFDQHLDGITAKEHIAMVPRKKRTNLVKHKKLRQGAGERTMRDPIRARRGFSAPPAREISILFIPDWVHLQGLSAVNLGCTPTLTILEVISGRRSRFSSVSYLTACQALHTSSNRKVRTLIPVEYLRKAHRNQESISGWTDDAARAGYGNTFTGQMITAAHGHTQSGGDSNAPPAFRKGRATGTLERNRISNKRGSGPLEITLTEQNATAQASTQRLYLCASVIRLAVRAGPF
ncbi:hypothetical protein EVAR_98374_1 [Eumeta japonica]|uniref:Uncharacterized protein n=1 Tax=Eumeta variegata TaxID=151549 RepID=A0A4C2A4I0_EUMVA|nr:hypothetical protein EVAR_98374_1 [Eumeta japonica]